MYRMVVTDLDGTLLNSQKQVSDANAKAIYKLKDQNITFVMATGRYDKGIHKTIKKCRYCHWM